MSKQKGVPGSPQPEHADVFATHHSSKTTNTSANPRKGSRQMPSYVPQPQTVAPRVSRLTDFPAARGFALPPVRGRSMWAVVVLSCAHCGSGHVHRSGDTDMVLSAKLVRRCPVNGKLYRVGPIQRRNEARRTVRLRQVA